MRMFARSGTFNLRFRHLNSQRFSRSHSHFVLPVVPTHFVLHHALSSHISSCLNQHRRLCVGVRAKLKMWCRACRSQTLDHRLRSTLCVFGAKREGVTIFPKKGAIRIWLGTWSSEMACRGKRGNASEKLKTSQRRSCQFSVGINERCNKVSTNFRLPERLPWHVGNIFHPTLRI